MEHTTRTRRTTVDDHHRHGRAATRRKLVSSAAPQQITGTTVDGNIGWREGGPGEADTLISPAAHYWPPVWIRRCSWINPPSTSIRVAECSTVDGSTSVSGRAGLGGCGSGCGAGRAGL